MMAVTSIDHSRQQSAAYVPVLADVYRSTRNNNFPLYWAILDIAIVSLFVLLFLIIVAFDFVVVSTPVGSLANVSSGRFGLAQISRGMNFWLSEVDLLVGANPPWIKLIAWSELYLDVPFLCFAIFCFVRGYDQVRLPSVMWSMKTLTAWILVMVESIFGAIPSPHPFLLLFVYSTRYVTALVLLFRVWNDSPFSLYFVRTLEIGRKRVGVWASAPADPGGSKAKPD